MAELFISGTVVDLIIGLMAVELVALSTAHRRTGRGVALSALAPTVLSGACLLLALRCSLTGARWEWIALWLLAALAGHLGDLRARRRCPESGIRR